LGGICKFDLIVQSKSELIT